jgi:hypothetical protein
MPLFVVLRPGLALDAVLKERINQAIDLVRQGNAGSRKKGRFGQFRAFCL